jgi:hypothetical protein
MKQEPIRARMLTDTTIAALDIVVTGSDPVTKLRKALLNNGVDPGLPLKVWRGGTVWVTFPHVGTVEQMKFRARNGGSSAQ